MFSKYPMTPILSPEGGWALAAGGLGGRARRRGQRSRRSRRSRGGGGRRVGRQRLHDLGPPSVLGQVGGLVLAGGNLVGQFADDLFLPVQFRQALVQGAWVGPLGELGHRYLPSAADL